jgi:hypothetical protein
VAKATALALAVHPHPANRARPRREGTRASGPQSHIRLVVL